MGIAEQHIAGAQELSAQSAGMETGVSMESDSSETQMFGSPSTSKPGSPGKSSQTQLPVQEPYNQAHVQVNPPARLEQLVEHSPCAYVAFIL